MQSPTIARPRRGNCDAIARPNGITTHSAGSPLKNRSLPFGNTASKSGVPCNPRIRENGGAEGIRTPDPHNAIVVLYQLSYDPNQSVRRARYGMGYGFVKSFSGQMHLH